jgi:hypothetical protein
MIEPAFYKTENLQFFFRVEGAGTCIWPLGCIYCRSLGYMTRCRDAPSILCLVFKHRHDCVTQWRMCKVVRSGQKKKYGLDRSAGRTVWFIIPQLYCRLCTRWEAEGHCVIGGPLGWVSEILIIKTGHLPREPSRRPDSHSSESDVQNN